MNRTLQKSSLLTPALLVGVHLAIAGSAARAQWKEWTPLGNHEFEASSGITALMPKAGHLNLLAVGKDGKLYINIWQKEMGWHGWSALGELKLPAKVPVEILMAADSPIELFAVGPGGKVRTTSWDEIPPWKEWVFIGEQTFEPGSRVTALPPREGRTDLFAIGKGGRVYTTFREKSKDWQEWSAIGELKVSATARITASSRSADRIDLFVVGQDGKAHSTTWEKGKGWQKWSIIAGGPFDAGSGVAVIEGKSAPGRIDLLAQGKDRKVYGTFREEGKDWQKWTRVGEMKFTEKTRVTAAPQPDYGLDLFAVGPWGAIRTVSGDAAKGWQQWGIIGSGTVQQPLSLPFPAGSAITVVDRQPHGENRIDLFAVARDKKVYTTFSEVKK